MNEGGTAFILTDKRHAVFYTGSTSDLPGCIMQHRNPAFPHSFTVKFKVFKLVYYQSFPTLAEAVYREKQLKRYSSIRRFAVIQEMNPGWVNLLK